MATVTHVPHPPAQSKSSKSRNTPGKDSRSTNARKLFCIDGDRDSTHLLSHRHSAVEELFSDKVTPDHAKVRGETDAMEDGISRRRSYFDEDPESMPTLPSPDILRSGLKPQRKKSGSLRGYGTETVDETNNPSGSSTTKHMNEAKKGLLNRYSIANTKLVNNDAETVLKKKLSVTGEDEELRNKKFAYGGLQNRQQHHRSSIIAASASSISSELEQQEIDALATNHENERKRNKLELSSTKMKLLVTHLQDNSSESSIINTLEEILSHTTTTICCEKVDLLIVDVARGVLTPMCQVINERSSMYEKISMLGEECTDGRYLTNLLGDDDEKIYFGENTIWSELLGSKRAPFVIAGGSKDDIKASLGSYFQKVVKCLPKECCEIRNVMAVPVRCTRGVAHSVAIMLCINKMADLEGSSLPVGHSPPKFDDINDVSFIYQLSQFAGIALANLELIYQVANKQDRLNSLVRIITQMSNEKSGEMLKHLFLDAQAICDAETMSLYTVDHGKSNLNLAYTSGSKLSSVTKIDQKSLPGIVAWTGHTMCASRGSSFDRMMRDDEHNILCVPVLYNDVVDAVIVASNKKGTTDFTLDDIDLLTILGKATGVLLHQTNTIKDKMSAARLADVSGRLIEMVTNPHNGIYFIIEEVCQDAILLVPAVTASIYFVDQGNDEIWTLNPNDRNKLIRLPLGVGMAGYCAQSRETVVVEDAYESGVFMRTVDDEGGFKTQSCISIPILQHTVEKQKRRHSRRTLPHRRKMSVKDRTSRRRKKFEWEREETMGAIKPIQDERRRSLSSATRRSTLGSLFSHDDLHREARDGSVVAVLQVINKTNMKGEVITFSEDDIIMLENYARKVESVFVGKMAHFQHLKLQLDANEHKNKGRDDNGRPEIDGTEKLLSLEKMSRNEDPVFLSHGHHAFRNYSNVMKVKAQKETKEIFGDNEMAELSKIAKSNLHGGEGGTSELTVTEYLEKMNLELTPDISSRSLGDSNYRHFSSWGHDVLQYDENGAKQFVYLVMDQFGFIAEFDVNEEVMKGFIGKVIGMYRETSFYHNFRHATQVIHSAACLLLEGPDANDCVAFGILIAAFCHDVDHPGHTNSFEIASNTALSRLYSDDSVLERHHSATTLNILNTDEYNILKTMGVDDVKEIRNVIIKAILSTDMSLHAQHLEELEKRSAGSFSDIDNDNATNGNLVESFITVVMHTSDLSSNSLPSFRKWGMLIASEFRKQAETEARCGIEVTPFMRDIVDDVSIAKVQFGFTFYVVLPWFEAVEAAEIFAFESKVDSLHDAIDYYNDCASGGSEEK